MHEEALLRDLRRKLRELARSEGNLPIRRVRLSVGALSHITPEALRNRWSEVVAGTPAEGSALEVYVAEDPSDPTAQGIRLVEIGVEETPRAPGPARTGEGPT